jgi:hypothetical protein
MRQYPIVRDNQVIIMAVAIDIAKEDSISGGTNASSNLT